MKARLKQVRNLVYADHEKRSAGEDRGVTGDSRNPTDDSRIEPTTPGKPDRRRIIIQLYKSNEPYGQLSDPQYVTFNP